MKMCQPHWDRLTQLVKDAGMWHLVSNNTEAALQQIKEELRTGQPTPASKADPLLMANNMIMGRALKMGGLYLMSGDFCPVCEAMKHTAHTPIVKGGPPAGEAWVERHWTEGVVLAILQMLRDEGVMPKVQ